MDLPFSKIRTAFRYASFGSALAFAFAPRLAAADQASLNEHLEPLRPLLGKTWRGEFKNSTPEKPVVDVARWERVLNGQAVRIMHSINNGVYGGETLIYWSKEKGSLVYRYFTTAGYETSGTMTIEGSKVTSLEKVAGDAGGVTEVKAISEIRPDGTYTVTSEYLTKDKWAPGHAATYHEDAKGEVVFK